MQVSLSFVLIVGAVLVIQSLQRIRTASPGFATMMRNFFSAIAGSVANGPAGPGLDSKPWRREGSRSGRRD